MAMAVVCIRVYFASRVTAENKWYLSDSSSTNVVKTDEVTVFDCSLGSRLNTEPFYEDSESCRTKYFTVPITHPNTRQSDQTHPARSPASKCESVRK